MKLNKVEKLLMNNLIRATLQNQYEAPLLERFGGKTQGLTVLEVGCGRGVGTEIIFEKFGAGFVHAFDLDPDMVRRAKKRLSKYPETRLKLSVGSVTQIEAADESYDAVFDFGIIHHVPNWRDAISEIRRTLKPGGRFFFEEVTKHALDRWFYRAFLDHPAEDRFTDKQFIAELKSQGFEIKRSTTRFFGDFVIGVATKASG